MNDAKDLAMTKAQQVATCDRCGRMLRVAGTRNPDARMLRRAKAANVSCFVKQVGSKPIFSIHDGIGRWNPEITDPKGGDPSEWPEDVRVRQWPLRRRDDDGVWRLHYLTDAAEIETAREFGAGLVEQCAMEQQEIPF